MKSLLFTIYINGLNSKESPVLLHTESYEDAIKIFKLALLSGYTAIIKTEKALMY